MIADNRAGGILLHTWGLVQANFIGTDVSGRRDLGNGGPGVLRSVDLSGRDCLADARDYYDTPLTEALGNTIAFNDGPGFVERTDRAYRGSRIVNNVFRANAGLGIDLEGDGLTLNDPLDVDEGANLRQNFPVIDAVATSRSGTDVSGRLEAEPDHDHLIELFSNRACDPSGYGEGEQPLDTFSVHTDGAGLATFTHRVPGRVRLGRPITATATGLDVVDLRNIGPADVAYTSEFSKCAVASRAGR